MHITFFLALVLTACASGQLKARSRPRPNVNSTTPATLPQRYHEFLPLLSQFHHGSGHAVVNGNISDASATNGTSAHIDSSSSAEGNGTDNITSLTTSKNQHHNSVPSSLLQPSIHHGAGNRYIPWSSVETSYAQRTTVGPWPSSGPSTPTPVSFPLNEQTTTSKPWSPWDWNDAYTTTSRPWKTLGWNNPYVTTPAPIPSPDERFPKTILETVIGGVAIKLTCTLEKAKKTPGSLSDWKFNGKSNSETALKTMLLPPCWPHCDSYVNDSGEVGTNPRPYVGYDPSDETVSRTALETTVGGVPIKFTCAIEKATESSVPSYHSGGLP